MSPNFPLWSSSFLGGALVSLGGASVSLGGTLKGTIVILGGFILNIWRRAKTSYTSVVIVITLVFVFIYSVTIQSHPDVLPEVSP